MSFDINPPNKNLSNIQASSGACPGGGGNTGYFKREKKDDESAVKLSAGSGLDSFEKQKDEEETQESIWELFIGFFAAIIDFIKGFFTTTAQNDEIKTGTVAQNETKS